MDKFQLVVRAFFLGLCALAALWVIAMIGEFVMFAIPTAVNG